MANEFLRLELLRMDDDDQAVRAELAGDGLLFEGYHPRMAMVHDTNAARLEAIIDEHGWPTVALVGADGAKAARRIAQHSINHPEFMRRCREMIDIASDQGAIPREYFAYIDDRIRVYEGLPQLYGTQWRDGLNGLEPYPLDDQAAVDARRQALGLPSHDQMRPKKPKRTSAEVIERKSALELEWRRRLGWIK